MTWARRSRPWPRLRRQGRRCRSLRSPPTGLGLGMPMAGGCRWPTGMWWRCWPMPGRCAPCRSARRLGWETSPGIGRGCGPSSSGWLDVAGWSRLLRACSPVPTAWLARWSWTAPPRPRPRRGEAERDGLFLVGFGCDDRTIRKSPMQAYDNDVDDTVLLEGEGPDAFGASRAAFDALIAALGGVQAGGWTHDQLENHLET